MSTKGKQRRSPGMAVIYVILGAAALFSIFPFYWMFVMATRPSAAYNSIPPTLLPGNAAGGQF